MTDYTITADRAREITANGIYSLAKAYESIATMAQGGYNYVVIDSKKMGDEANRSRIAADLQLNGYTVEHDSSYFKITW